MGRGGRGGGGSRGGGRSSGLGGGRSSGIRSGGGFSSGRGGSSGLGSRGGSSGSWGGRPSGGHRSGSGMSPLVSGGIGYMMGRNSRSGYRRGGSFRGGHGGGGCGCAGFSSLIIMFLVLFAIMVFISLIQGTASSINIGGQGITRSTERREALPRGSVVETAYYTDELDWIRNKTTLETGMRNFYQRTGVQPYLYITGNINGTQNKITAAEADAFMEAKYDELFKDEAHLLIVFYEPVPNSYQVAHMAGRQAKTVIDDEAVSILLDYIDRYYYKDYEEDYYFSKAFNDASKRIMTVTRSPWIPVMTLGIIALLVMLAFSWWKKAKEQKNREAEQTERILGTKLYEYGESDEAQKLVKKYNEIKESNPNNDNKN